MRGVRSASAERDLTAVDLDLVRCPRCKGPLKLALATRALGCAPCCASHPWRADLGAWDLRVDVRDARTARGSVGGVAAGAAEAPRLWQALRAVHDALPRQGVIAWLDVDAPSARAGFAGDFARSVSLATNPERLAAAAPAGHALVALVNADALPLASRSIDLVDGRLPDASTQAVLEAQLAEVHRVLASSGHAYFVFPRGGLPFASAECAARAAFADGYGWAPPGGGSTLGTERLAAMYRHAQMWLGFEYTLGRGIQRTRPAAITRLLGRLRAQRELVCWRARPDGDEWKRTPSHVPMVFGRFHFPEPASPA